MPTARASTVIHAPIAQVWRLIREFGSFPLWVPTVESAEFLDGPATVVGTVQRLKFKNGTSQEERLTGLDDANFSLSYASIGQRPPPAFNLVGRIDLSSITSDNSTFIERTVQFDCALDADETAQLAASIGAALDGSLRQLAALFDDIACSS